LKKEISWPREGCALQEKRDAILEAQNEAVKLQFRNDPPAGRFVELASLLGIPLALILLAVMAYIYNEDIGRVVNPFLARQIPSLGYSTDRQTITYFANPNGQFEIDGRANGIWFRFVADTGAAGIVFSKADAHRLGFNTSVLPFDLTAWTANGPVRAALVRLKKLEIGPIVVIDVPALIDDGDLQSPLLGMEFFKRMSTIEINNDTLTIRR
jgi:clan AA aspartic protease (TIGR02281 family)